MKNHLHFFIVEKLDETSRLELGSLNPISLDECSHCQEKMPAL
jgi:hypothetical protein